MTRGPAAVLDGFGRILLICGLAACARAPGTTLPVAAVAANVSTPGAAGAPAAQRPVILTGEVIAPGSQPIIVPPSDSSPVVLRNFVADGTVVKQGDLVMRIEVQGGGSVLQLTTDLDTAIAKAEREVADLEVKAIEAEKALATADAALAKAKVDAALPKGQVSALDYDRYHGELERAARDREVKQQALDAANAAVARRREDAALESKKIGFNLAYAKVRQKEAEVHALRDGVVVHGYSEWRGERYEEGSSAFPGNSVGTVIGGDGVEVRAWALEADRPFLDEGQEVALAFDVDRDSRVGGRIRRISSAPEARAIWGSGRYFKVEIELLDTAPLELAAGMSVRVEPAAERTAAARPAATPAELTLEGELASRVNSPVSPPAIEEVWQYTLANLVPEGTLVKQGTLLAQFENNDVATRLESKRSTLKEKLRAREKMTLDHAEGERAAELAVQEAASKAERAALKAAQPKELIRRIDYDKNVVDRVMNQRLATLAERQRDSQARARRAERAALEAEIRQLTGNIAELERGQAAMSVVAPRDGLLLYRSQFNGEKFASGSQVWMGLSVANLADPAQIVVNAKVPEAQSKAIALGQAATVKVQGSSQALAAHVSALGRAYHSKSKTQPVVVRDVELSFDAAPQGLKPGAAVQVAVAVAAAAKEKS